MTRKILLLLLISIAAHAQTVRYDPVAPTTNDAVKLWIATSWSYHCPPDAVNVEVNGHAIAVTIVAKKPECQIGFPFIGGWSGIRAIGPLPAGVYTITARLDTGSPSIGSVQEPPLVVREANSTIQVRTVDLLPSMAQVAFHSDVPLVCSTTPCITDVSAGNVHATHVTLVTPTDGIATIENLTPGTYDFSITHNGTAVTAGSALQVIDENVSAFQQQRSVERILIPVLFSGPGAFGAQWVTEASVTNADVVPIDFYHTVFSGGPLRPGETRTLNMNVAGPHPNGMFLYVPRGESRSIQFNALVRDLSRQSEALGTEMPIVRESEFLHQRFNLLGVPTDPRFRVTLRAYGLGGQPITIRIFKMGPEAPAPVDNILQLTLNGEPEAMSSLVVTDLVAKYPQLNGAGPLRIELARQFEGDFGPGDPGLWAFASVTNNDTQHVTVISPQ